MWKKKSFSGLVSQACGMVPGFEKGYRKVERLVVLKGLSTGLLTNYGRNVAQLSLHFGRCPELVSVEEINCYLYHKAAVFTSNPVSTPKSVPVAAQAGCTSSCILERTPRLFKTQSIRPVTPYWNRIFYQPAKSVI